MRPEGLSKKKKKTSSGLEPATFRFVAHSNDKTDNPWILEYDSK
jgi:hypothetical protein